jgi:hypothetical protein
VAWLANVLLGADPVLARCTIASLRQQVLLSDADSLEAARQLLARVGGNWVLKAVNTNNALGVHFFPAHAFNDAVAAARAEGAASAPGAASGPSAPTAPNTQPAPAGAGEPGGPTCGEETGAGAGAGLGGEPDAGPLVDPSSGVVGADAGVSAGAGGAGPSRSLLYPWVLQRYVDDPLLVQGRKFHMRVNVLAVGCPVKVRQRW